MISDEVRLQVEELTQNGRMLLAAQKPEEAAKVIARAQELDPTYAESYNAMGAVLMKQKQYRQAKEQFKKALLIDKTQGRTYFDLGNACLMLDELSECLSNYNRALDAGYDHAEMQFFIALAYEQMDQDDMALRHLTRAILKDPSMAEYKVKKMVILARLNRSAEAMQMAEELIHSAPELYEGYHARTQLLLGQGNYAAAVAKPKEAMERFPEDVGLLLDYARSEALAGNLDLAISVLERAEAMPYFEQSRQEFMLLRAQIFAQKQNFAQAIAELKACIALGGNDRNVWEGRQMLMNLLMLTQDYEGLYEVASAQVAQESGDEFYRAALYYQALALKNLNRDAEAKTAYRQAIMIYRNETLKRPAQLDAYLYRAMALRDLEDYDKALEVIDLVISLNEKIAEPHTIRADIYRKQGKLAEAKAEEDTAVLLKPELKALYTAQ